ncbi:tRNA 2-thiouridine synthesizing protein A [Hydrogenispora ethanolica]|jgi:tRNA 2-thiouridine synthesizing protein A|uniref:tRNA 2-thiouridine synthesizing protein A n=1 Tax=Hydrogenispora ethanolica TaxID=1082276 RepID=A0A4R1R9B4_HYDET|nr:sulfurtransferase TusA family protein [Hydrogenispora ethanolica]TCL62169.1 tRNA 2-thiouridine synthesizing protein A [Hydrogenispora ethanolica]
MSEVKKSIDLHGVVCPLNFVKTKLALEELAAGERLEVVLDEGDAMLNVPRSLKEEGHKIIKVTPEGEVYRIIVEKGV